MAERDNVEFSGGAVMRSPKLEAYQFAADYHDGLAPSAATKCYPVPQPSASCAQSFGNGLRVLRRDLQQCARRAVRLTPTLFPVLEGRHTNADH